MKKHTQYTKLGALLKRSQGATTLELMRASLSSCVHKRMTEMRRKGWTITRTPIKGKNYGRYKGKPPTKEALRWIEHIRDQKSAAVAQALIHSKKG